MYDVSTLRDLIVSSLDNEVDEDAHVRLRVRSRSWGVLQVQAIDLDDREKVEVFEIEIAQTED